VALSEKYSYICSVSSERRYVYFWIGESVFIICLRKSGKFGNRR